MGDFHPDTGETDHDGSGDQVNDSGVLLQSFKVGKPLVH
jgi:hypothetical protein